MSAVLDICDGVVAELNAKDDWSVEFTAVRRFQFVREPSELSSLSVAVMPIAPETERYTRGALMHHVKAYVVLRQKVAPSATDQHEPDHTAADAILDLAEEVRDYLIGQETLTLVDGVELEEAGLPYPHWPVDFARDGIFSSVVELTYRTAEAL